MVLNVLYYILQTKGAGYGLTRGLDWAPVHDCPIPSLSSTPSAALASSGLLGESGCWTHQPCCSVCPGKHFQCVFCPLLAYLSPREFNINNILPEIILHLKASGIDDPNRCLSPTNIPIRQFFVSVWPWEIKNTEQCWLYRVWEILSKAVN